MVGDWDCGRARMAMVSMARLMFCPSWLGWATFYE
jgi:hypothetical protein